MMRVLMAVVLFVGLVSQQAWAAKHSEFFGQPKGGTGEYKLTPQYRLSTYKDSQTIPSVSSTTDEINGWGLGANYERGLTDMFALGLESTYWNYTVEQTARSNGTVDPKFKRTGWEEIQFKFRGAYDINSSWNFYFGHIFGYSPTQYKAAHNFTGQSYFQPHVGIGYALSELVLGAKASYKHKLKGKFTIPNSVTVFTGGHELDLILLAEYHQTSWLAGLSTDFRMVTKQTSVATIDTTAGTVTTTSAADAYSLLELKGYSVFHVMGQLDLIPALTYQTRMSSSLNSEDSVTTFNGAETKSARASTRQSTVITGEVGIRYTL